MNTKGKDDGPKRAILADAIRKLEENTGLISSIQGPQGIGALGDYELEIARPPSPAIRFIAEVKVVDRFQVPAQVQAQLRGHPNPPLLVAPYISLETAQQCRKLKLAFIDSVGNAYIETPGIYIWSVGNPRPKNAPGTSKTTLGEAGLKISFALLCQPPLLNETYRRIAEVAAVSLGAVGPAIKGLERDGYIQRDRKQRARLANSKRLLDEWVTLYPRLLRRKLNPRTFDADPEALMKLNLREETGAFWAGESAAARLTGILKPGSHTIYVGGPITKLAAAARLRKARDGGLVEILDVFWNLPPDQERPDLVPPILIYADLLATSEGRSVEAADVIYEQYIEPALKTD
jgi:hypothetical protein